MRHGGCYRETGGAADDAKPVTAKPFEAAPAVPATRELTVASDTTASCSATFLKWNPYIAIRTASKKADGYFPTT